MKSMLNPSKLNSLHPAVVGFSFFESCLRPVLMDLLMPDGKALVNNHFGKGRIKEAESVWRERLLSDS
jgi:hypothetical protein